MTYNFSLPQFRPALLKTLLTNLVYLQPRIALKIPIIVSSRTIVKGSGKIAIDGKIFPGMVKLGFSGLDFSVQHFPHTLIQLDGHLSLKGFSFIGVGSRIFINQNGIMELGEKFTASSEITIVCNKHITIGDDVIISWGTQIMDTDFHKILYNGEHVNIDKDINIGSHTWISSHVIIGKGVKIAENSIIAAGSVLTKDYPDSNSLLGGVPAKVLRSGVDWMR